MAMKSGSADWDGALKTGSGTFRLGSGACELPYAYGARFGEEIGASPEELIGTAHAACVAMALAHRLDQAGYSPKHIHITSKLDFHAEKDGFVTSRILLEAEADVSDISDEVFQRLAEDAKNSSPVSRLLTGAEIVLHASLAGTPREEVMI